MLQRGYRMPKPQHLDEELYVKMRATLILYYISVFFQLTLFNQEFYVIVMCAARFTLTKYETYASCMSTRPSLARRYF